LAQIRVDWDWFRCEAAGVGPDGFFVLSALISFKRNDRLTCWPGQEQLRRVTGFGVNRLKRVLRQLKEAGWIECQPRKYRSMAYRLHSWILSIPQAERCAWETHQKPERVAANV
jgi:hypothetical protein